MELRKEMGGGCEDEAREGQREEVREEVRRSPGLRSLASLLGSLVCVPTVVAAESRVFEFSYQASIGPVEAGRGPIHLFVPLAIENQQQRIVSERIEASIPGEIEREERYGNRFWHGQAESSDGFALTVSVKTVVERRILQRELPLASVGINGERREEFSEFLGSNSRVVVGHPVLEPIRAEVRERSTGDDPAALSRAIYDWVVDNVEYKKVGSGWGNGDTFWACNERYGNCTDFHALFISLARTEGIPARFEIGFPVPDDRDQGNIAGYHCWVEFYLPETGWFPIDASEAFKHPEKRELFYGTHPADRIHFTTGRDLQLGAAHRGKPLNYFVYPYVEVGGEAWSGPIEKSFAFTEKSSAEALGEIGSPPPVQNGAAE
jgi:transglutaminase-like putative cysteine protease